MSVTASYKTLIARATESASDDPTLIYDITDKVNSGGSAGATEVSNAIQERLNQSESHVRLRVLNVIDTLVIECGSNLHQAIIQTGLLVTLANLKDQQVEAALPEHIAAWQSEMGAEYETAFKQAFAQRGTTSSGGSSGGATSKQNTANNTTLTRRAIGGMGQLKLKPVSPLYPFMTIAYFRALRILEAARDLHVFHMQSIHIARQALHLVILLNDAVDQEDGPSSEQEDERIDLEDELMDLEDAMADWAKLELNSDSRQKFLDYVPGIKEQYVQFFRSRFYYTNPRDPEHDRIYQKLLAYDKKTIWLKRLQLGFEDDAGDDDEAKSEAYIESVHTSPAPTGREVPGVEETTVSLSQVNIKLDPSSAPDHGGATEQAIASTSAAGASSSDALEAARKFRKQEEEGDAPEQSFTCPVPGCGKTFEKQHLLKHHIREHDDRPYRCPMRGCDRRFATPNEQRVHEALHRIRNMGIVPNMPDFAPPTAHTSAPAPPPPEPVAPVIPAEEVKPEGKPEGEPRDEGDRRSEGDDEAKPTGDDQNKPLPEEVEQALPRPGDDEAQLIAEAIQKSLDDQQKKEEEDLAEATAASRSTLPGQDEDEPSTST